MSNLTGSRSVFHILLHPVNLLTVTSVINLREEAQRLYPNGDVGHITTIKLLKRMQYRITQTVNWTGGVLQGEDNPDIALRPKVPADRPADRAVEAAERLKQQAAPPIQTKKERELLARQKRNQTKSAVR